ncbi:MAG: four helix bundle protein [Syntrophobacteraceae bacterium]
MWKQAIEPAKAAYELTAGFPAFELYRLTSQMRRSSVSIASNMAEGAARGSDKEFIHFLYIAMGSVAEPDTQYILSKEPQFTKSNVEFEKSLADIRKVTSGLIRHLKNK